MFAAVVRDTRGLVLSDMERFNHFPASPLMTVTYVVEGALHLVPTGCTLAQARTMPPLPPLHVFPPQDGPVSSWSDGPVAVVTLAIYPEAWVKLGLNGSDSAVAQAVANTFCDLQHGDDLSGHCAGQWAGQWVAQWARFCDAVDPLWQEVRGAGGLADWSGSRRLADWSRSIANRAALAGPGRSLRAFERRLRRWSQHSKQSLKFFAEFEDLHRLSRDQPHASLAALATDAGYADQSHMGRAVRRGTGFSPAQLNQHIATNEAFWFYRLLGEHF